MRQLSDNGLPGHMMTFFIAMKKQNRSTKPSRLHHAEGLVDPIDRFAIFFQLFSRFSGRGIHQTVLERYIKK
jgi:hypothetical protein